MCGRGSVGTVVDFAYTSRAYSVSQARVRGVHSSSVRPRNLLEFNFRAIYSSFDRVILQRALLVITNTLTLSRCYDDALTNCIPACTATTQSIAQTLSPIQKSNTKKKKGKGSEDLRLQCPMHTEYE